MNHAAVIAMSLPIRRKITKKDNLEMSNEIAHQRQTSAVGLLLKATLQHLFFTFSLVT